MGLLNVLNRFKIRRGPTLPKTNVLEQYELGYVTSTNELCIGEATDGGVVPKILNDVGIGSGSTPSNDGYKVWIDEDDDSITVSKNNDVTTIGFNSNVTLSDKCYGTTLPSTSEKGRIFFLKLSPSSTQSANDTEAV